MTCGGAERREHDHRIVVRACQERNENSSLCPKEPHGPNQPLVKAGLPLDASRLCAAYGAPSARLSISSTHRSAITRRVNKRPAASPWISKRAPTRHLSFID